MVSNDLDGKYELIGELRLEETNGRRGEIIKTIRLK